MPRRGACAIFHKVVHQRLHQSAQPRLVRLIARKWEPVSLASSSRDTGGLQVLQMAAHTSFSGRPRRCDSVLPLVPQALFIDPKRGRFLSVGHQHSTFCESDFPVPVARETDGWPMITSTPPSNARTLRHRQPQDSHCPHPLSAVAISSASAGFLPEQSSAGWSSGLSSIAKQTRAQPSPLSASQLGSPSESLVSGRGCVRHFEAEAR